MANLKVLLYPCADFLLQEFKELRSKLEGREKDLAQQIISKRPEDVPVSIALQKDRLQRLQEELEEVSLKKANKKQQQQQQQQQK